MIASYLIFSQKHQANNIAKKGKGKDIPGEGVVIRSKRSEKNYASKHEGKNGWEPTSAHSSMIKMTRQKNSQGTRSIQFLRDTPFSARANAACYLVPVDPLPIFRVVRVFKTHIALVVDAIFWVYQDACADSGA